MDEIVELVFAIFLIVVLVTCVQIWNYVQCGNKAEMMGFRSSYGVTTGCMIERGPGLWVPIGSYRTME